MKTTAIALMGLALLSDPVLAAVEVGDWRAEQIRVAEEEFAWLSPVRPPLYQAQPFPDGVKGLLISSLPPREGWHLPLDTPPEIQARYNAYCFPDALILAQTEGSQSVLTSDSRAILTRTRLRVLDVIKAPANLSAGDQIAVVRFGGEVVDHGERLRVRDDSWSDFSPGHVFLLRLAAVQAQGMDHYFSLLYREAAIANLQLAGEWSSFAAGTAYADVKEELARIPKRFACPAPR